MAVQERRRSEQGVARVPVQKVQRVLARKRQLSTGSTYILLIALAILFIAPAGWMLSTALKSQSDVSSFPPSIIPNPALWSNFAAALTVVPFFQFMWNTCLIVFFTLIGDVFSSAFVAYGFAFLRFRYREVLFFLVLATMMVPYEVLLIPQFILFKNLGWINTYLPLIVPTYFGSPFLIFLLRQAFRSISRELVDAARLDGANHFVIWWRIVLPLSRPALAAVAIFSFMFHWNDLIGPLVYLNSTDLYPISLGLAQYTAAYGQTLWNFLMAASLVAVLPCLLIFFFFQRYLVQSILVSGTRSLRESEGTE